jgi:hypothetical protein
MDAFEALSFGCTEYYEVFCGSVEVKTQKIKEAGTERFPKIYFEHNLMRRSEYKQATIK